MASQYPYRTPAAPAEQARLEELRSYNILDTPRESQYDNIVALARVLFDAPISSISLIDEDRQWQKAAAGAERAESPRSESFCAQAMMDDKVFVVPDAANDSRFVNNAHVVNEPNIRFYAGAPLRSPGGHPLGAVCVISSNPRGEFSAEDQRKLRLLADIVGNEMELRRRAQGAHKMLHERDMAMREAHFRIKTSLGYATLLAELDAEEAPIEKVTAAAMVAWKQYQEAGGLLNAAIKALRDRMPREEYSRFVSEMPGFVV